MNTVEITILILSICFSLLSIGWIFYIYLTNQVHEIDNFFSDEPFNKKKEKIAKKYAKYLYKRYKNKGPEDLQNLLKESLRFSIYYIDLETRARSQNEDICPYFEREIELKLSYPEYVVYQEVINIAKKEGVIK